MNILIVYVHDEPSSFTGAMKNSAVETLSQQGHNVVVSDLYAIGFSPVAQKWDFVTTTGDHFNYMLEQKHAANLDMAFSPDIVAEIAKIKSADLIIFATPIWWHGVPALLKGWLDRVLAMGFAWNTGLIYEKGLLRGKQAILVGSAGGPAEFYQPDGKHKATINQILHPINHGTLAFCGLNVHEPFVALNVLGQDQPNLEQTLKQLEYRLQNLTTSPQWLVYYN